MGEAQVHAFMSSSPKQDLYLVKTETFDDGVRLLVSPRSDRGWGDEFRRLDRSGGAHENRRASCGGSFVQTGISIDGYAAALDKSRQWGVASEDEGVQLWGVDS